MFKTDYRGTEVTDFLRCRKKYDYAWIQNLEPKQRNEKLTIGSAIHKFLEVWYATGSELGAFGELKAYMEEHSSEMDELQYEDAVTLVTNVCANYIKEYNCDDILYEVVAVEMPFSVQLNSETNYVGTIDLLLKDQDGKYWFMDHKTTASLDIFDKNSDMDRQISRYWAALEKLGYPIEGFIYNIILKDYPVPPKVLKSGALSKDKSQRTTWELYYKAIKDNNLKEEDYADFLQLLEDQPKEFFRRVTVGRTEAERYAALQEVEQVIDDIRHIRWTYRNITKDCTWDCPFKALCVAEMDGSNANYIRNELYRVKESVQDEVHEML